MLLRLFVLLLILNISIAVSSSDPLPAITQENIDQITEVLISENAGSVVQIRWNPAGDRFAVVRHDDSNEVLEIWDLNESPLSISQTLVIHPELVSQVHWVSNESIVTHGSQYNDGEARFYVQVWNTETGTRENVLLDNIVERPVLTEFEGQKYYGAVVPPILAWNNDYTNSATSDGQLAFQLPDGNRFSAGDDDEHRWIRQVLWSPGDRFIAVVYGSGDVYQIQLLDAETLETLTLAYGMDYLVSEMAWSPDSSSLAVASIWANPFTPTVNIRFYGVGEPVFYGEDEIILSADIPDESRYRSATFAWHPDGTIIGVGFPETLEFYETDSFTMLAQVDLEEVTTLDWHPLGILIVSGDVSGTIRMWGVPSDS